MERQAGAALLHSASQLIKLLEKETHLLLSMRPKEIEGLQKEKAVLVSDYQARLTAAADTSAALESLAPAVRQELAATAAALTAAINDNERALTAAKLATDQLVHSIAAAVLEEQRVQDLYRADGSNGRRAGPGAGAPVAVSINEIL